MLKLIIVTLHIHRENAQGKVCKTKVFTKCLFSLDVWVVSKQSSYILYTYDSAFLTNSRSL